MSTKTYNKGVWRPSKPFHSIHYGLIAGNPKPSILISRLLLRMRRMYVANIRLDFH